MAQRLKEQLEWFTSQIIEQRMSGFRSPWLHHVMLDVDGYPGGPRLQVVLLVHLTPTCPQCCHAHFCDISRIHKSVVKHLQSQRISSLYSLAIKHGCLASTCGLKGTGYTVYTYIIIYIYIYGCRHTYPANGQGDIPEECAIFDSFCISP